MPRHEHLVVTLAGAVGSGKTTIARALATELNATMAGFGDYVRHVASEVNCRLDRTSLQNLGQKLVETDARGFASRFLDWAHLDPSRAIVIEGMRHVSVDDAIRDWSEAIGARHLLIFVVTDRFVRANRRAGGDVDALRLVDDHAAERETLEDLRSRADLTINGTSPLPALVNFIRATINGGSGRGGGSK